MPTRRSAAAQLLALVILSIHKPTESFSVKPMGCSRVVQTVLFASTNRKRRVRRKEFPSESPEQPDEEIILTPRDDSGVKLQVTDVRNLSGGQQQESVPVSAGSMESPQSPSTYQPSASFDDSLDQLLRDAKQMKASEKPADADESLLRKVISTIVTVDFFVVCAFLVWFLAGIFCSYVLKDDTVQIAFNSSFQQLVQPALGVLMIASIADAVSKGEDDDDNDDDRE